VVAGSNPVGPAIFTFMVFNGVYFVFRCSYPCGFIVIFFSPFLRNMFFSGIAFPIGVRISPDFSAIFIAFSNRSFGTVKTSSNSSPPYNASS
jgi:hypothetical protein